MQIHVRNGSTVADDVEHCTTGRPVCGHRTSIVSRCRNLLAIRIAPVLCNYLFRNLPADVAASRTEEGEMLWWSGQQPARPLNLQAASTVILKLILRTEASLWGLRSCDSRQGTEASLLNEKVNFGFLKTLEIWQCNKLMYMLIFKAKIQLSLCLMG
jgi:hypothetical protein